MDPSVDPSTLPHDHRGGVVVGVACLMCSIATVAVGLRFYTRAVLIKQVGPDDYLALLALLIALATGVSQSVNALYGLGKHVWDLQGPQETMEYLKHFYVSITLYNSGLMFVKLTFLMQYYRVLAVKKMHTICIVAMAIIGSWSLSQVLVGIFICDPIAGFWDSSLNATCIPNLPQWYINAAGNIATDLAIFVLPMPVLGHLNLPRVQRLVLIGIFSLGFFTCAISVIRIKYLKQGGDSTYENVDASAWSITELCSGVTCACLPTLRPLVSRWVPSLSSRLHRSDSRGYHRRRSSAGSNATNDASAAAAAAEPGSFSFSFSRHRRGSSNASHGFRGASIEELFTFKGLHRIRSAEAYPGGGGGGGITMGMGLKSAKEESLHSDDGDGGGGGGGGGGSPTTPVSPQMVHYPAGRKAHPDTSWLLSSVTTEIGTSNSPRPDADRDRDRGDRPDRSIRVKHDVVMEENYSARFLRGGDEPAAVLRS
ncbi:hypothetical protein F4780DRAFT_772205 [Xylariomycetidae sp. FL0641]|nr:hypothetical protein F4780DRAFT_772205 [Xylariomycetidae sp. FL0641]